MTAFVCVEPPGSERLALLTPHRWPVGMERLRVRFLDGDSRVWARIVDLELGPEGWSSACGLPFEFVRTGEAEIRVSFEPGACWSHYGTICAELPQERPSMNLDLTLDSPTRSVWRKWLHEAGHALGFIHEHGSVRSTNEWPWDWPAFRRWHEERGLDVEAALREWHCPGPPSPLVDHDAADAYSVMCYGAEGAWFTDGRPRGGSFRLSIDDRRRAREWYGPPPFNWQRVWMPHVES